MLPCNLGLAWAFWTVPAAQAAQVPLWHHYTSIAPLDWWAIGVLAACVALVIGFAADHLWVIRIAYAFLGFIWLLSFLFAYESALGFFLIDLCGAIAIACICRQAVLWYQNRVRAPCQT